VDSSSVIDWNGAEEDTYVATFICDAGNANVYVKKGETPDAPFAGYTWTPALGAITKNTTYKGTK
jgi:hypothetical protein